MIRFAPNLEIIEFEIPKWGKGNKKLTDKSSVYIADFFSNMPNVKEIKINIFENGLENYNYTG